jgi:DUF4097 and DUF4098 domain-containing protein YvlB
VVSIQHLLVYFYFENRHSKPMKTIAQYLTILLILNVNCRAQVPDDYSFKQSFRTGEPASVNIKTNDGFIHAYSADTREIGVYFIVRRNNRVQDMNLKELRDELEVEISFANNTLDIVIEQRYGNWITNWRDRYNVSLHIIAPKRTDNNLRTSDGDIELVDFVGDQECRTSDGNINAEDISGALEARTSDGGINALNVKGDIGLHTSDGDIFAENILGDLEAKTSDGEITVEDVKGNVYAVTSDGDVSIRQSRGRHEARTSDGNIRFEELDGGLVARTSDGDIRGDFSTLDQPLKLKTSDGNISVAVPRNLGMNILLKGEDLDVLLEDFSGETSDNRIEGSLRGGGVEVELITTDGDVALNYN